MISERVNENHFRKDTAAEKGTIKEQHCPTTMMMRLTTGGRVQQTCHCIHYNHSMGSFFSQTLKKRAHLEGNVLYSNYSIK